MLRDAELDKENASVGHGLNNHKVPDMNASAKRKFVLRFGDNKWSNDMHVAQIKAIYGKSVKEGMLTLEDKANVKVLIKATPAECQRLMKTLTTLKGQSKEAQHAHLTALGSCAKCASKNAAAAAKAEERQKKMAAQQLVTAEAEAARKRKREEMAAERDSDKARRISEQLQRVETMRAAKEAAKEDIEAAKRRIEEKRLAARAEKDKLRGDAEALAETRRAVAAEREALEAEKKNLETTRLQIEKERISVQKAREMLDAQLDAHESTLKSLEIAKNAVEKERAVIAEERARVERETARYEEERKASEAKKAAWEEAKKHSENESARRRGATSPSSSPAGASPDAARFCMRQRYFCRWDLMFALVRPSTFISRRIDFGFAASRPRAFTAASNRECSSGLHTKRRFCCPSPIGSPETTGDDETALWPRAAFAPWYSIDIGEAEFCMF